MQPHRSFAPCPFWAALLLAGMIVLAPDMLAAQAPGAAGSAAAPPGATLESLLLLARQDNPELRMAAQEATAVEARARAAGTLPDPTLTLLSDENMVEQGRWWPSAVGNLTVSLQQAFPLGGRRGLARQAAEADARQAGQRSRGAGQDVEMRIKMAFAEHYQVARTIALLAEIRELLLRLSGLAESRYARGIGMQQEALAMRVEVAMTDAEIRRMEAERGGARSRINVLLARPPQAPLADPLRLPPLPAEAALAYGGLVERARQNNPLLAAQAAQTESADANQELMRRSWWPDLMLGFGVKTARDGTRSYEAMVGVNLPLQWAARNAQIEESAAMSAAARARLESVVLQTQGELGEALAALAGQREAARVLSDSALPQTRIAFETATSSYELGRGDSTAMLDIARRLRQVQLDLLRAQVEAAKRLAVVERIIGEDL